MAVTAHAVPVGTTAERLDAVDDGDNRIRKLASVAVCNNGSAIVYIGGSDVTDEEGYPLGPGQHLGIEVSHGEGVYAVAATGTQDVRVLEENVG